jgi:hypothetical protein
MKKKKPSVISKCIEFDNTTTNLKIFYDPKINKNPINSKKIISIRMYYKINNQYYTYLFKPKYFSPFNYYISGVLYNKLFTQTNKFTSLDIFLNLSTFLRILSSTSVGIFHPF